MPRPEAALRSRSLKQLAPLFAALGDETRLHLVARLATGEPLSMTRLTTGTRITRQAVAKHLRVLADVGLVQDIQQGRERLWQLRVSELENARRCLELIGAEWDLALQRLRLHVER